MSIVRLAVCDYPGHAADIARLMQWSKISDKLPAFSFSFSPLRIASAERKS